MELSSHSGCLRFSTNQFTNSSESPIIACCPYDREDLLCFIVMHKEVDGLKRIVCSDLIGSFMSSGGGQTNIEYLIKDMIKRNMSEYDVSILKVSKEEWIKLEESKYYDSRLFHRLGAHDQICSDIFYKWFMKKHLASKTEIYN